MASPRKSSGSHDGFLEDFALSQGRSPGVGPPSGSALRLPELLRESLMVTDADLSSPGPRILVVNQGFTNLTGYQAHEVLGKSPRILQGPKTDREVLNRLRECLQRGESFEGETTNYRRDGTEYIVHWYVEPVRDAHGRVVYFCAVQRDVTPERAASNALAQLARALAEMNDGAAVLRQDGIIDYANASLCEMLGESRDSLVGQPVLGGRLFDRSTSSRILLALRRTSRFRGEVVLRATGKVFEITVASLPGTRGADEGYVAIARDVTEKRRVEALTANLTMSDSLGLVFAGIRHELGNPINSLKAALGVLRDNHQKFSIDKINSYFDRMIEQVQRMEYLLGALRAYNSLATPEKVDIELDDFLLDLEALLGPDCQTRQVELEVLGESGLRVKADRRALYHVLLNLINNAVEAMATSRVKHVSVIAHRRGREVEIAVADSGSGMSAAVQRSLFRPFQTTKQKGTGMGLVVVQRLLTQMGGTIFVETTEGVGTTFRIRLDAA